MLSGVTIVSKADAERELRREAKRDKKRDKKKEKKKRKDSKKRDGGGGGSSTDDASDDDRDRRERSSSHLRDTSGGDGVPLEVPGPSSAPGAPSAREAWMTSGTSFGEDAAKARDPRSSAQRAREEAAERSAAVAAERELNPHWANGGDGFKRDEPRAEKGQADPKGHLPRAFAEPVSRGRLGEENNAPLRVFPVRRGGTLRARVSQVPGRRRQQKAERFAKIRKQKQRGGEIHRGRGYRARGAAKGRRGRREGRAGKAAHAQTRGAWVQILRRRRPSFRRPPAHGVGGTRGERVRVGRVPPRQKKGRIRVWKTRDSIRVRKETLSDPRCSARSLRAIPPAWCRARRPGTCPPPRRSARS